MGGRLSKFVRIANQKAATQLAAFLPSHCFKSAIKSAKEAKLPPPVPKPTCRAKATIRGCQLQPTVRRGSEPGLHVGCGSCSMTQNTKSVSACWIPNRLSLDATCPRW